jgi:phosphatidylserine/phosphatidylglycerophosphate/cardiolipin synthase-like enzyme
MNNKTLAGGIGGIVILIFALFAQFALGIDVLNVDEGDDAVVEENVAGGEWYNLYFTSPINTDDRSEHTGSTIEQQVINAIDNAQQTIDGAFYELNLESVANALVRAENRGVEVRLVVDDDAFMIEEIFDPEDSTLDVFQAANFGIYCEEYAEELAFETGASEAEAQPTLEFLTPAQYDIRCDDRGALMHHKFMIIDGFTVWTGSMNMTHNGVYNNNNNYMQIRSSRIAQNFQYMFNLMFDEGNFNLRGTDGYDVPNRRVSVSGVQVETYFSPDDGDAVEQRIVEEIRAADDNVRVMVFNLFLDSVGDALLDRVEAGIDVQGVFHPAGSIRGGQMSKIGCAGAPVRQSGNPDVLHHKVIVVDSETVITGSFNFSNNARDNNNEVVLIIDSPELAQAFLEEFERTFNDPRADVPTRAELEC